MAIRARKHRFSNNLNPVGIMPQDRRTPQELLDIVRDQAHDGEDSLNAIARIFSIRVEYRPLKTDASGSLTFNTEEDQWVITLNSLHHPKRQRFTFAHELAHYFLHRNENNEFSDAVFFRADNVNSPMEYEANNFAGALLMPKDEFIHYVRTESNSIESVSNHFNVSAMAVKVRADVIRGNSYEF
ncbi:ImmA/IrrE family metallo-endopeptidase [Vibrio ostreae]|uniref:ImmA/IrrE family metallo-endopeptidase n=1 Tax=Vibrio ostreae TaxID=2841925 RepID=A0A975U9M1_9VIBR|nr:ImmA/IrrE family metallo-endopeptidase [Vibrio ostreae]QXO16992.1 ImmA/IrrE family metallo-endopeptidase [Vibrio ostreae]